VTRENAVRQDEATTKKAAHVKTRPPGPKAQPGADEAGAAEPAPLVLTLRDVAPPPAPAEEPKPMDDGLVRTDAEARPVPWLGDPEAERAEQKVTRRAQVRRERVRDTEPGALDAPQAPAVPAVLVFCVAGVANSPLGTLLAAFGFRVITAQEPPVLAPPWPFAAIFVDTTAGALPGDAIDLCNQVRESSRLPGERKPVLMLVAAQLSPTDRVRAGLAGCNEVIVGEVSRGSVARALEARGIALPADARRG
jgi:hypothetical protein